MLSLVFSRLLEVAFELFENEELVARSHLSSHLHHKTTFLYNLAKRDEYFLRGKQAHS